MEKDDTAPKPATESTRTQLKYTTLGEMTAFALAIGAVYLTEHAYPAQTQAFIRRLAGRIGQWRGTSAEVQQELAKKITEVGLMNVGGGAGVGLQYMLRRHDIKPEERESLPYEAGRLVAGRTVGTATAIGTLTLAETLMPTVMRATETRGAALLGGSPRSLRFAGLVLSNAIQSAGAILGNVPGQLLYDRLLGRSPSHDKA